MEKIGNLFFKYRSYTPLPLILIMIFFINPIIYSIITGFVISVCGELIRIWAVSYAGSETRTTESAGGTHLVTQGPFSYLRNPLYLGNILIYTGLGIMSNSLFPYLQIFAFLYFTIQYYFIIIAEEKYLSDKFKDVFETYKNIVNRFIPGFRKIPLNIRSGLEFDLKNGLLSEKRSLQALILMISLILFFYFTDLKITDYF